MTETKTAFVPYTNTDLTEGRGFDVPLGVCQLEMTAKRIGKGKYVQGTDAPIREVFLFKHAGKWYAPPSAYNYIMPSIEDRKAQKDLDEQVAIIKKARDAGLTDEELRTLSGMRW